MKAQQAQPVPPGKLAITPLAPALGARVTGVDLAQPLDEATWQELHRAYLERHLLSVPGQRLEPEHVLAFSRRFGPLEPHVLEQYHHPRFPEIMVLSNVVRDGKPTGLADAGSYWHSDVSYKARPSRATMLYALEVPEGEGDTLFVNLVAACRDLPEGLRRRLQGRRAVHNYAHRYNAMKAEVGIRPPLTEQQLRETPSVTQPVLRTHPETGQLAIYINPGFTVRIEGLPEAESEALKAEVFQHCLQPQYQIRYRWHVGDVLIWDNAAVMHSATTRDLDPSKHRTLLRTVISGEAAV